MNCSLGEQFRCYNAAIKQGEGGENMMCSAERRQQVLEFVVSKRHTFLKEISNEFGVSFSTARRDVQILSCSYPIYTSPGGDGGIYTVPGYRLGMKYLTEEQASLLEKISHNLVGEDLNTMNCILKTYKRPDHDSKRYG